MTGPMSVLMLTNAVAPDKLGGLERYVRELSATLVRLGVDVTVASKRTHPGQADRETGADGVRILRHTVPSKRNPAFAPLYPARVHGGVRAAVRDLDLRDGACDGGVPTLIHGHYAITTLPVAFGRRPYLYTFHAPVHKEMLSERNGSYLLPSWARSGAVAAVRRGEGRVVRRASAAIVLSAFMQREVEELSPGRPVAMVPGGIDTDRFCPGTCPREDWAAGAAPLLFTARRLTGRTGVAELVRAMPAVLRHHPGTRLAVAGDGPLRQDIAAEIDRMGLTGVVRLLGRISDDDLLGWYRAADLTVMPTRELEGFGLTTAESLACGTPVLGTPVGANPELLGGLHPLLVATGTTADDLAGSLCGLLDAPGVLAAAAAGARAHVHPRWSWDAVARRHIDIYSRLAARAVAARQAAGTRIGARA